MQNTMRAAQIYTVLHCYTSLSVQCKVELQGMLDTGSMVAMFSADIVSHVREAGVLPGDIVLVDCGPGML